MADSITNQNNPGESPGESPGSGTLDVVVRSTEIGVTLEFPVPLLALVLSPRDAYVLAQALLAKAQESEQGAFLGDVEYWLTALPTLEVVLALKALVAIVEGDTGAAPAYLATLRGLLNDAVRDTALLDLVMSEVTRPGALDRLRLAGPVGERAVNFLDWVAAMPTVPPKQ